MWNKGNRQVIEVSDFPARDICCLHVVPRGLTRWGEFLGRRRRRRRRRRRHLELQVNILAGELYLEFVPMELGPGGSSERFETGVLQRILISFIWAEWSGLGSHFCKNINMSGKCTFSQMGMSKKSRNVNFWRKTKQNAGGQ